MIDSNTIAILLPEIVLVVMAAWMFVGGTFAQGRGAWTTFAVLSFLVAALALCWHQGWARTELFPSGQSSGLDGPLAVDDLAYAFRWAALAVGVLLVLTASRTGREELTGEKLGLLMLTIVGLMLVASAGELVFLFVGLELISVPTYVLLFLGRRDHDSAEAAAKYFFLSILSSALFLYGLSFLYGSSGSTRLEEISAVLIAAQSSAGGADVSSLAPVALVLIFAGLGFKIAAVPFHFYAPDVYQGTTNANAALLAVVPKIAGVVALVRLLAIGMPALANYGWQLCLAVSLLTMTVGNVCALWQNNVRRLMAYSSIAHAGYMLIGLAASLATAGRGGVAHQGIAAMLFYLAVYVLATTGIFAALAYLSGRESQLRGIDQLAGLGRTRPAVAAVIAVCLFSLAGIPLLAGFWGKLALFVSALQVASVVDSTSTRAWFIALAIVGAVNAAIAAAYYLRVVAAMYFRAPLAEPPAQGGRGALAAALACALLIVGIGALPGSLMTRAGNAAYSTRLDVSGPVTQTAALRQERQIRMSGKGASGGLSATAGKGRQAAHGTQDSNGTHVETAALDKKEESPH